MSLVSVIVPTYDRPEFIQGAVETALGQTHDEIEVVIVCDPPIAETRAALGRYEDDERVRAFYNDERIGISASRNRAIEHARGEYICILDDDDRWRPSKVERQLDVMAEHPDCGVVYTGGLIRKNGRIVGSYTPSMRGDIYPTILAGFDLKPYSSHMLRAECFETVGSYDTAFECGEDWDHAIRVAREYEYEYVDEPLVVRQFHDCNVSNQGVPDRTEDVDLEEAMDIPAQIWSKYRPEIERHPEIERQLRYGRHVAYGWKEIDRNNRRRALRYGLGAAKYGPTVTGLSICCLALLGPTALDLARTARDTIVHSQFAHSSEEHVTK
ncbi:glycosyltransferase family 2 protein [Natronolimnohabitans sp. A-GB9]|uniref:glycosyltransferase family 2 protein n=1 Tax=Natronolimnohabitans sp. A-GB9 TaxID=3069757 RepID=UPI0027B6AAE2|nr:glycosyltransferase family 2 protein [Natronolimnohabitans sp. A-GB9]MDQ2051476.1 glycosyltransferase family 2 protein [Natronolimnohabitans sp. A-GB9]